MAPNIVELSVCWILEMSELKLTEPKSSKHGQRSWMQRRTTLQQKKTTIMQSRMAVDFCRKFLTWWNAWHFQFRAICDSPVSPLKKCSTNKVETNMRLFLNEKLNQSFAAMVVTVWEESCAKHQYGQKGESQKHALFTRELNLHLTMCKMCDHFLTPMLRRCNKTRISSTQLNFPHSWLKLVRPLPALLRGLTGMLVAAAAARAASASATTSGATGDDGMGARGFLQGTRAEKERKTRFVLFSAKYSRCIYLPLDFHSSVPLLRTRPQ